MGRGVGGLVAMGAGAIGVGCLVGGRVAVGLGCAAVVTVTGAGLGRFGGGSLGAGVGVPPLAGVLTLLAVAAAGVCSGSVDGGDDSQTVRVSTATSVAIARPEVVGVAGTSLVGDDAVPSLCSRIVPNTTALPARVVAITPSTNVVSEIRTLFSGFSFDIV